MTLKALILILAAVSAVAQEPASAPAAYEGRITGVEGDVVLFDAQHPQGAAPLDGMPLETGDRVVTGEGGLAQIVLDGQSAISLAHKTDFTVTSLDRAKAEFSLGFGTLLAKIRSLLPAETLQVRTPVAVAAVRGTEFGVTAPEGGETRIGVFDEGRVEVSGQQGTPQVVGPSQETRVARGGAPLAPSRLEFFKAYRKTMRGLSSHLTREGKRWRSLTPNQRREVREKRFQDRSRHLERQERREERRGR